QLSAVEPSSLTTDTWQLATEDEEVRRAAGARVLTRYVLAAQGIYEQVLSGALPASAVAARGHLEQALEQLQGAVPSFLPVQDDYSFRCAPQVLGPALDTCAHVRAVLTCELNSATDNPLIFPPDGPKDCNDYSRSLTVAACKRAVVSGCNFHGEPV